jgi:hypothetical protein
MKAIAQMMKKPDGLGEQRQLIRYASEQDSEENEVSNSSD